MAVRKLTISEVRTLAGDEFKKGQIIVDQGKLRHLSHTDKKLYAEAAGSRGSTYQASITFDDQGKVLGKRGRRGNCTCRAAWSRDFCKHAAALLLAWAKTPEAFAATEAPPEPEPKAGDKDGGPRKRSGKAGGASKKVDGNELKTQGAERVDTLVRELAVTGVGGASAERVAQLQELGANLFQLQLRRLEVRTLELAQLLQRDNAAAHATPVASALGDMLLTAARIKAHCEGKTLDARYVNELIGVTWKKKDREPTDGLQLLEYGFTERTNVKDMRIVTNRFLDLHSGQHYVRMQLTPKQIIKRTKANPSFAGKVLDGAGGGLYPGFAPRRLHFEDKPDNPRPRPQTDADLEQALTHAAPIKAAITAFQAHRRDVFAPDRIPVLVRTTGLVAQGGRLRVFDEAGDTVHLWARPGLEARLDDVLEGCTMLAIFGELDLDHAIPTLWPTRLLVREPAGLRLRNVNVPHRRRGKALPPRPWAEVAREAGLPYAAVSLGEVREELAELLVGGLAGLDARAVEPLVERLQTLKLAKPAQLLESLAALPDPAQRVGGFVKVFQVLEVALVRLSGAVALERDGLVPVPTHTSIYITEPAQALTPSEAMTERLRGTISRYEAAVHYHRHYRTLCAEQLAEDHLALSDGAAAPYVIDAIAQRPEHAVTVAERILSVPMGTVALRTAFTLLGRSGTPEAELILKAYSGKRRKVGKRFGQRVVHMADDALVFLQRGRPRLSPLAESRVDHLEYKLGPLLSQARSDKDADRRALGCEGLAELGATEAIPDLRTIFRTDRSGKVREQAALSLGMLGDATIVEELLLAVRRHGPKDKSMAHAACRALGHLGDSRALPTMAKLYVEGFTASVMADTWLRFGVLALEPIASMIDAEPSLAKRSALAAPLQLMPTDFVVERLFARLCGEATTVDLDDEATAKRASAYLKLCVDNRTTQAALARRIVEGHTGTSTICRRTLASARKYLPSA